jgi:hypothetical protein
MPERCLWAHKCVGCGDEVYGNVTVCTPCFLRLPEGIRSLVSTTLENLHQPGVAQVNWQGLQAMAQWLKDNPRPAGDPAIRRHRQGDS